MSLKRFISFSALLLYSSLSFAEGKKTFYAGRSVFFWILLAGIVYTGYKYYLIPDKKNFFKSNFNYSAAICFLLLFFTFIGANIFLKDPVVRKFDKDEAKEVDLLLASDAKNLKAVENDFTDPHKHYKYISGHTLIPRQWTIKETINYRDDLTLENYYYDKLNFEDSLYVNMAKFSLGIYYYEIDSLNKSIALLESSGKYNFPYSQHYLAMAYLQKEDTASSISHFRASVRNKDVLLNQSYVKLISLLHAKGQEEELFLLLKNPDTEKYFPYSLASKLYFQSNQIIKYYKAKILHSHNNSKITGFIGALLIMLVWLAYIIRVDIFDKENLITMATVLLWGMVLSFLCYYFYDLLQYNWDFDLNGQLFNDLIYCIFGIGLIEESIKIIPLLFMLIFFPKDVDEPYDYILYACLSSLGFAFIENIMYFEGTLSGILHGRAMSSVPGHMIFSSIIAYGFVLSKFRYKGKNSVLIILLFFLLGIVSHGLYDYWLFIHIPPLFLFHFLVSVSLWILIINNSLNNSPYFTYKLKLSSQKLQLYMALTFVGIYTLEYILVAWEEGPSFANEELNGALIIGGIITVYYTHKLTNMDFIKGYWAGIGFRSIINKRRDENFSFIGYIGRLVYGDIIPHSFTGKNIIIYTNQKNPELFQFLPTQLKATIIDRIVVSCISRIKKEEYKDPYWFILRTETPISPESAKPENQFIFRFDADRPSNKIGVAQDINLYTFKNNTAYPVEGIRRADLRSLGRAFLIIS